MRVYDPHIAVGGEGAENLRGRAAVNAVQRDSTRMRLHKLQTLAGADVKTRPVDDGARTALRHGHRAALRINLRAAARDDATLRKREREWRLHSKHKCHRARIRARNIYMQQLLKTFRHRELSYCSSYNFTGQRLLNG